MTRMTNWLRSQAALMSSPAPFKLTPGQLADLGRETGNYMTAFHSPLGRHPIIPIYCSTRAVGDNVILAPREDLFIEAENPEGVRLVSVGNSVTSVPDNIAAVEVISAGEFVTGIKAGDIVFIDFFLVKQGYILENEELYVAGSDAFAAKFDCSTQEIAPLDNYVTTKRAVSRMKDAMIGHTELHMPEYRMTDGIVSGRTSKGGEAAHVVYEEVVRVGRLTKRPRPGVMTRAERAVLAVVSRGIEKYGADSWVQYDGVDEEEAEVFNAYRRELLEGREPDVKPGDLAVFCREVSTQLRVRGEFRSLIPYVSVLALIDDSEIVKKAATAANLKPRLVL